MNIEQAENEVTAVEQEVFKAERDLATANEALLFARGVLRDLRQAKANEPTEDKIIDMSHFIDSGLIMEFWSDVSKMKWLDYLHVILNVSNCKYTNKHGESFKYCSPKVNHDYASMTGWDKPPIPEGYKIEATLTATGCTDSRLKIIEYGGLDWNNVLVFRITGIRDGFKHE